MKLINFIFLSFIFLHLFSSQGISQTCWMCPLNNCNYCWWSYTGSMNNSNIDPNTTIDNGSSNGSTPTNCNETASLFESGVCAIAVVNIYGNSCNVSVIEGCGLGLCYTSLKSSTCNQVSKAYWQITLTHTETCGISSIAAISHEYYNRIFINC